MPTTAATPGLPLSTGPNVQLPTQYKTNIDSDELVSSRTALAFAPHQLSTPAMKVAVGPGSLMTIGVGAGTGTLTEIGSYTTGSFSSGATSVTVANPAGIANGMQVTGPGIPAGTTAIISGSTVTLSNMTTAAGAAGTPLVFEQLTATITAPVSNSRIDRVVADQTTGAVSVITGTPGASPVAPAITAGKMPIAQVLLTSSSTSIINSMITDERNFNAAGLASASGYPIGTSGSTVPLNNSNNTVSGNNTYTGSNGFTGGSITVPTKTAGTATTDAASTAFVATAEQYNEYTWIAAAGGSTTAYTGSVSPSPANGLQLGLMVIVATAGVGTNTVAGPTFQLNGLGSAAQIYSGAPPYNPLPIGQLPFYAELQWNGAVWICLNPSVNAGFSKVVQQFFNANGTYSPTTGMQYCEVELFAAGGGAGGTGTSSSNISGGGGQGGGASKIFTAATIGASQSITVGGAGSAGGGGVSPSSGGTGGNTSLGALLVATGGVGSPSSNAGTATAGGAGGSVSTGGTINYIGQAGAHAITTLSGDGGGGWPGSGARGLSAAGNGNTAAGYSGGGGGAFAASAGGGAGFQGYVLITEYCQ